MAVAVYAVAIQLQNMYMMFSTAISSVFLPKVTSMVARGANDEEISNLFIRTGRLQYIIMSYILSLFIVFGKQFIQLWAGDGYQGAYYFCLMFFIPLTISLIQNLGITILQARNQMKFRSLLYIVVALASLGLSILLAKSYGGYGCAFSTSLALLLGQGIIMNIYYQRKQCLDIIRFWNEILKMSVVPAVLVVIGWLMINGNLFNSITVVKFMAAALCFTIIYWTLFWRLSMNQDERNLIVQPLIKLVKHE